MNEKKKTLILIGLFIILVAGASVLYSSLSKNYQPNTLLVEENTSNSTADESTPNTESTESTNQPETSSSENKNLAPNFTVYDLEGNEVNLTDFFGKPIILNFWASWCGPCKMIGPIIDQIADERTDIKVGKINVDEEQELAVQFKVMSIPTLLVFKDGKVVNQSLGAKPKAAILAMLD